MLESLRTLLAKHRSLPDLFSGCNDTKRISSAAWGFESKSTDGLAVHFDPRAWDSLDLDLLLLCCQHARSELARKFGFLVGRVDAFLFESRDAIAALYGRPVLGFALPIPDWIVISRHDHLEDAARHELVHLFAARWSRWVPPLPCEGLAVWLTRSHFGRPIDAAAREIVRFYGPLSGFLADNRFFDPSFVDGHHILAGSFTGYLLRRFDWGRYRELYRRAKTATFERDFQKVIGVTLQKADASWRAELRHDNVVKITRVGSPGTELEFAL